MFICVSAGSVLAADNEIKPPKTLICAISSYYECTLESGCQKSSADEINAPRFFKIHLDEKTVTPMGQLSAKPHKSKIVSMTYLDGMVVLQGVEDGDIKKPDGVGWTASINVESGKIALTASGLDVGFVGMGACAAY